MRENKLDIHVCFLDVSKDGAYDTQGPIIIRKYGQEYVAISSKTDVCESYKNSNIVRVMLRGEVIFRIGWIV